VAKTKEGDMQNLFNYTTLSTRLEKNTRTLFITLNRADWKNAFRLETLFELESILSWCITRVEIQSIYIDSSTEFFSSGLELEELDKLESSHLEKIQTKLQKIIQGMMQLPQTIIIDAGKGSETLASEFLLGADIRLCDEEASISFNHHHFGLIPACGGMSLLPLQISKAQAQSWVFSGDKILSPELTKSGFIYKTYNSQTKNQVKQELLFSISKSSPVSRIQTKLGIFEAQRSVIELGISSDKKISKACLTTEDWKSKKRDEEINDFMPAKSFSYAVKLSLIKSDETTNSH